MQDRTQRLRAVLFDIDGTLIDSNDAHAEAWKQSLSEQGHQVSYEKLRHLIGMGADNLLPEAIHVPKDSALGKQLEARYTEIFQSEYLPHLQPFPEAHALLQRLREAGYKLATATSSKKEQLDTVLKMLDADNLFEKEVSGSDASHSKPDPDIVQVALDRVRCRPNEAVLIGDTPFDLQSAQKSEVPMIAFRCGGWTDSDFSGAIGVYQDPADLLANFDQSPLGKPKAR